MAFAKEQPLDARTVEQFRREAQGLTEQARFVLLDLQRVDFVDSAGLRTLIGMRRAVHKRGGDLLLLRPRSSVREVLEVTRLIRVFPTFSDVAEAHRYLRARVSSTPGHHEELSFETTVHPGGTLVRVSGSDSLDQLNIGGLVQQLGLLSRSAEQVVLDLREITHVDAAAVAALAAAQARTKDVGVTVWFWVESETVQKIFARVPECKDLVITSRGDTLRTLRAETSESEGDAQEPLVVRDTFVDMGLVLNLERQAQSARREA